MSDGWSTEPAPSHTSTDEWQSFEVRMRRRRAERCVLRAEVALHAGFEEDARLALEEARRLDSSAPDLDALRERISHLIEPPAAEAPAPPPRRRRLLPIAAAVTLFLSGVLGYWAVMPGEDDVVAAPANSTPP